MTTDAHDAARPDREPTYLTVQEVARHLRISKMSAYRLIEAGSLPAYRFGRGLRVSVEDLASFRERSRTTT